MSDSNYRWCYWPPLMPRGRGSVTALVDQYAECYSALLSQPFCVKQRCALLRSLACNGHRAHAACLKVVTDDSIYLPLPVWRGFCRAGIYTVPR